MHRFLAGWLALAVVGCKGDPADTAPTGPTGTDPTDTTDTQDTDTEDTSSTDACPAAEVWFEGTDGSLLEMTSFFQSGDYLTLSSPGTLTVCPGTWFARVLLRANVDIVGLGASPADTVLSGGESGTIVDIAGPDVTVNVRNVTLDRGAGLDVDHNSGGGGLYCEQFGAVTVEDAVFTNNFANDGSALYARDCTVDVRRTTFADNLSEDDGGALTLWFSTATLDEVAFDRNTSLDGGALAMFNSDLTVTNSSFTSNHGSNFSGGVWAYESSLSMTDVAFTGNVNDGSDYGGALIVFGDAELTRVSFHDNVAPIGGGLFVYYDSTVTGTSCDFANNTPDDIRAANDTPDGGTSYTGSADYSFVCANNACEPM